MAIEEFLYVLAGVDAAAVPDEHDVTWDLAKEVAEEKDHLDLRDVLPMEMQVESHALPLETDGHGRDDRDPVVPIAMFDDGRFAAWGPRASDVRDQ